MKYFATEEQKKLSTDIEKLALKISEYSDMRDNLEQQLKNINQIVNDSERELAELLDNEGFAIGSKIKLSNGRTLAIKEYFSATIPSNTAIMGEKNPEKQSDLVDKKEKCLAWLDENKLGEVIKNQVVVIFQRGENEKAKALAETLQEKGLSFTKDESVHAMTLRATLKDALRQGISVPFDLFSVQTGTVVEIK